jgi:uncharacterized protein (TIGR03000 family)
MYHVILAAALATSAATPNNCFRGFHCSSCYSSCACYSGYSGYAGYAGYAPGCMGGCNFNPGFGYGAAGGCYGYHGGCYGGWGVFSHEVFPGGYYGCTGCYGCYGGYAGYGVPVPLQPLNLKQKVVDPYPPINPDAKKNVGEEVPLPKEKKKVNDEVRGTIKMSIPENAKLFVDGKQIDVTPGMLTFRTPALTAGQTYFYDFRIEVTRDGALIADERRIYVRAGQETAAVFSNVPPPIVNTSAVNR